MFNSINNKIQKFEKFNESKTNYSSKNLISEICVSMILLNPEFLDNVLDRGLKARYSEDSRIFLTDLKNLILSKNRLNLGKFHEDKFIIDDEISKINSIIDNIDFDIERDWNVLVDARITARAIVDKLLPDDKLKPEYIRNVFWIGPNKIGEYKEDIVIDLNSGKQYSIFLNKSLSSTKTASFNKLADDLIGKDIDILFKDKYLNRWNKLAQSWVSLIYENVDNDIKTHIEKFIDPDRIDSITYFRFLDIKHSDPRFKHLGEYMVEFDKNIVNLQDLLNEIWKNRQNLFLDLDRVEKRWIEIKNVVLNSKILENLLTSSLKKNYSNFIKKKKDGYKISSGYVKMKLFKTMVEKMGCLERDVYYIGKRGLDFSVIPSRQFFRKFYDDLDMLFDYHVTFPSENEDFNIKLRLDMDGTNLIEMDIIVKFSGGEMSGKLSAKYNFELSPTFNLTVNNKKMSDY